MTADVAEQDPDQPSSPVDRKLLAEALAEAREQNLNLLDEVIGARAAAAQARQDHDATFYLLDVTTRQLNELKAALGYEPEADVADIVNAIETSTIPPRTDTDDAADHGRIGSAVAWLPWARRRR